MTVIIMGLGVVETGSTNICSTEAGGQPYAHGAGACAGQVTGVG
jgi:hypothetical protein